MKKRLLAASAAALLALSACGTTDAQNENSNASSGTSTASSEATKPTESPRGGMLVDVGQTTTITCDNKDCATFVIPRIEWIDSCENQYGGPVGHLLAVDIEIETLPDVPNDGLQGLFQPSNFKVISDEITSGAFDTIPPCNVATTDITNLAPSSKYKTTYTFDVPENATTLILDAFGAVTWEWDIPKPGTDSSPAETAPPAAPAAQTTPAATPQPVAPAEYEPQPVPVTTIIECDGQVVSDVSECFPDLPPPPPIYDTSGEAQTHNGCQAGWIDDPTLCGYVESKYGN